MVAVVEGQIQQVQMVVQAAAVVRLIMQEVLETLQAHPHPKETMAVVAQVQEVFQAVEVAVLLR
jgi:hypothetical protein